jgi:hypothetical protein
MNRTIDLDEVAGRSIRHWHQDGLPELTVGFMMFAGGSIFLISHGLSRGSSASRVYALVAPILWACSSLAAGRALKTLKAIIVVPRTGHMVPPDRKSSKSRLWASIVPAVLIAVAGILRIVVYPNVDLSQMGRMVGPGLAVLCAASFFIAGLKYQWLHMFWLAAVSLLLGALTYWRGSGLEGALWMMVGLGAAMALSGAWLLIDFLKANPKSDVSQS